MQTTLITGTAGFIGSHTAQRLLEKGHTIIGIDSCNDYYDPKLKHKRNEKLLAYPNYHFYEQDLSDYEALKKIIDEKQPELIIHLAAQPGVRYSLTNPWAYLYNNDLATMNIFECARNCSIPRVIFASSSSVYGGNTKTPFAEEDSVDYPVSLYAATKKANEVMAHAYHAMYGTKMIGLRFFTVYGEYGRPDMALFKYVRRMLKGEPIQVFNNGDMWRDNTYVTDIVSGIEGAINRDDIDYDIFNLGGDNPVKLLDFIEMVEHHLGIEAKKEFLPMQTGDVYQTYADISKSRRELGFEPRTPTDESVRRFCAWFKENEDWLMELSEGKQ